MSGSNERTADPDTVVTDETGARIRPGRFAGDGQGITITPPGESEPDYDDGSAQSGDLV